MKIAVEGCAHGELDTIYDTIAQIELEHKIKIDLLICCGDFQSIRNYADMDCMAVPKKYQTLNSFYKYYSGEKEAPVLTLFIGGNHEASNYLCELPFGGWVAPNIYFLGYAGCVRFGPARIAALSGIYKGYDYARGRFEVPPYDNNTKKSCYHIRNLDVFRLKQLSGHIDIGLSHDWPRGIPASSAEEAAAPNDEALFNVECNKELLLRIKKHFRDDVESGKLGSKPTADLVASLKPTYWFAAHLHVKFPAMLKFNTRPGGKEGAVTRFLALDKCLPKRDFLQILDIPSDPEESPKLSYDSEWLAIVKWTDHLWNFGNGANYMPGPCVGSSERFDFTPKPEELSQVQALFSGDFVIPCNFSHTAPPLTLPSPQPRSTPPTANTLRNNPQTSQFCQRLKIRDYHTLIRSSNKRLSTQNVPLNHSLDMNATLDPNETSLNPDEISINDSSDVESDVDEDDEVCPETTRDFTESIFGTSASDVTESASTPRLSTLKLPQPKKTTDVVDLGFVLDTAPSEPRPKTPPVCQQRDSKIDSEVKPDSESELKPEVDSQSASNDGKRKSGDDVDLNDESAVVLKPKFKRRNASMYQTDDT